MRASRRRKGEGGQRGSVSYWPADASRLTPHASRCGPLPLGALAPNQIHLWQDELAEIAEQHKLHGGGGNGGGGGGGPAAQAPHPLDSPLATAPAGVDQDVWTIGGNGRAGAGAGVGAGREQSAHDKLDVLISSVCGLQAELKDLRSSVARIEAVVGLRDAAQAEGVG